MLDHISIKVADYPRSQAFYDQALKPLGVSRLVGDGAFFGGYGSGDKPYFWIGKGEQRGGTHVAFAAATRALVDAFYAAAIAAGGRDNGPPGLREEYDPTYYGRLCPGPGWAQHRGGLSRAGVSSDHISSVKLERHTPYSYLPGMVQWLKLLPALVALVLATLFVLTTAPHSLFG